LERRYEFSQVTPGTNFPLNGPGSPIQNLFVNPNLASSSTNAAYGGDPDASLIEFNKVLKLDPNNANALFIIGMIRWKDKLDADGAIKAWSLMLKRNPHHQQRAQVEDLITRAKLHGAAQ
jgi:hypothetical protein